MYFMGQRNTFHSCLVVLGDRRLYPGQIEECKATTSNPLQQTYNSSIRCSLQPSYLTQVQQLGVQAPTLSLLNLLLFWSFILDFHHVHCTYPMLHRGSFAYPISNAIAQSVKLLPPCSCPCRSTVWRTVCFPLECSHVLLLLCRVSLKPTVYRNPFVPLATLLQLLYGVVTLLHIVFVL